MNWRRERIILGGKEIINQNIIHSLSRGDVWKSREFLRIGTIRVPLHSPHIWKGGIGNITVPMRVFHFLIALK